MATERSTVANGLCKVQTLGSSVILLAAAASMLAAEPAGSDAVKVLDGVVQPRRPVAEAMAEAMQFLKKADGNYKPGAIDGPLAGYYTSAFVKPDGTRSPRALAYPARHHAYFIFTFLRYYSYSGEREWLLRARDLADWNLAHSTPRGAVYANLPYSTYQDGHRCGGKDGKSIEPDKAAFLGSAYVAVYEATGDTKYLDGARRIADTLVRTQREDGSWPFRVVPEGAAIQQDFGGAPVFFAEFFESLGRYEDKPTCHRAHDRALKYMLQTHVEENAWGTYHEDIKARDKDYLSAEPMSFTADYLFRHGKEHPEYVEMGKRVIQRMEEKLVHTKGHPAAPAPAVAEQAGFNHMMPGHTARYCRALADWYAVTQDEQVKRRGLSGLNATTYMQSPAGLFRTFFQSVNPNVPTEKRPDWYSQHLYTVCHTLEAMSALPELVPDGQDHLLDSTVFAQEVIYSPGKVIFKTIAAATSVLKLSFVPQAVFVGSQEVIEIKTDEKQDGYGWFIDARTKLLTVRHPAGEVTVVKTRR